MMDLWGKMDLLYQDGVVMDKEDVHHLKKFNQFLTDIIKDKINKK